MPPDCCATNCAASSPTSPSRSEPRPTLTSPPNAATKSPAEFSKSSPAIAASNSGIVTKSNLIVRDLDLLKEVAKTNRLSVHMTVTTLDVELARILEPRAPRPDLRIDAVRTLSQAGLRVGVSCSPVIPGITDAPKDLEALIRTAAEAGADYVFANPLFLKPCSAAVFLPFLEQNFPHLAENYRQRYQDRAFLPPAYGKRLSELVKRLREKYKLTRADRRDRSAFATKWPAQAFDEQMNLF